MFLYTIQLRMENKEVQVDIDGKIEAVAPTPVAPVVSTGCWAFKLPLKRFRYFRSKQAVLSSKAPSL